MDKVVDVTYREVSNEPIEKLTQDVNSIWEQMETLGQYGIVLAARGGKILRTLKERVEHGKWGEWCTENLKFSERKAQNMMKLSLKAEEAGSLFSNPQIFADLSISKVYELLAAPEEVVKKVVVDGEATDKTVSELREEIKNLKAAYCEKEKDVSALEAQLKKAIEEAATENDSEKVQKFEEEIKNLSDKLQKAKDKLKASEKKQKQEVEETATKAREEARKEALKQAEDIVAKETADIRNKYEEAVSQVDKLKRQNEAGETLTVFKLKADALQQNFNDCLSMTETISESQGTKLKMALKKIVEMMNERIG